MKNHIDILNEDVFAAFDCEMVDFYSAKAAGVMTLHGGSPPVKFHNLLFGRINKRPQKRAQW